jgi:phospholipid transport system substrate-binding protein
MKRLLALCLLAFLAFPALAQDGGPEALVKKITQDVMDAIKTDKQLAAGDKQKALKLAEEKILPHVDFQEATRLAVGRAWSQASPEQKKKLVDEFRRMLVRTYSSAISSYQGQTMKVLPVRMKPDDTEVTVRNQYIRPGAKPVALDYAMRKTDGGYGLIKALAQKNTPPAGVGSTSK